MFWLDIVSKTHWAWYFASAQSIKIPGSVRLKKTKKIDKTPFGHHLYAKSVQFADSDLFFFGVWLQTTFMTGTTFMISFHIKSRRHKTVFPVQEDILGQRSSRPLLVTSGLNTVAAPPSVLYAARRLPANQAWVRMIDPVTTFAQS